VSISIVERSVGMLMNVAFGILCLNYAYHCNADGRRHIRKKSATRCPVGDRSSFTDMKSRLTLSWRVKEKHCCYYMQNITFIDTVRGHS